MIRELQSELDCRKCYPATEDHMRDLTIFHVVHNIGGSPVLTKFMDHKPHGSIDVPE